MLRKLIKYEILANYKEHAVLYAGMAVTSLFLGALTFISDRTNTMIMGSLFNILLFVFIILSVIGICMTFVIAVGRFYKSLVRDEGYLYHTLPVPTWQLILSKLVTAYLWLLTSLLVIGVCLGIAANEPLWVSKLPEAYRLMKAEISSLGESGWLFMGYMFGSALLAPFIVLSQAYFSFAVGNLSNKGKMGFSALTFIGLYIAQQVIGITVMVVGLRAGGVFHYTSDVPDTAVFSALAPTLAAMFFITVAISAACYIFANVIFTKKLNLE